MLEAELDLALDDLEALLEELLEELAAGGSETYLPPEPPQTRQATPFVTEILPLPLQRVQSWPYP